MKRNTVLANAVALALGVGGGTALAAGSIGVPFATSPNPPTFASEITASAGLPATLHMPGPPIANGEIGFGVSAGQSVFLRFDLSGDGAAFASNFVPSPTLMVSCTNNGTATGTIVAGGAGSGYVIFQVTAPSVGCAQSAPYYLFMPGIAVSSTNATASIAYGEYATAPDAANKTTPLASASATLLKFASTLTAVGAAGSPLEISVESNNTLFVGSATVSPIGEFALANVTKHHGQFLTTGLYGSTYLFASNGAPNPLLAAGSGKDVLTVTGDFSAAPTTGSGSLSASAVYLSNTSGCGGTMVPATALTATQATFDLSNTTYGSVTATGAINTPEYVCYQVNGTTPIQFGVTYTAKYQPTAATGYTLAASYPLTLGTLNTNGVTATVLNIPNGSGGDSPYIRIYNTSSLAGPIRGTLYGQDGTVLYSGVLIPSLAPGAVQVLTASDLQTLAGQSWTGRAYLEVFGQIPAMDVQALIRDANGTLVNVSSKAPSN